MSTTPAAPESAETLRIRNAMENSHLLPYADLHGEYVHVEGVIYRLSFRVVSVIYPYATQRIFADATDIDKDHPAAFGVSDLADPETFHRFQPALDRLLAAHTATLAAS